MSTPMKLLGQFSPKFSVEPSMEVELLRVCSNGDAAFTLQDGHDVHICMVKVVKNLLPWEDFS